MAMVLEPDQYNRPIAPIGYCDGLPEEAVSTPSVHRARMPFLRAAGSCDRHGATAHAMRRPLSTMVQPRWPLHDLVGRLDPFKGLETVRAKDVIQKAHRRSAIVNRVTQVTLKNLNLNYNGGAASSM